MKRSFDQIKLDLNESSDQNELKNKEITPFIAKTYEFLENPEYNEYVAWVDTGSQFEIKDVIRFENQVLKKHFKHKSIISFIRQLNLYGFKKVRSKEMTFEHKHFQKNSTSNLYKIQRKTKIPKLQQNTQEKVQFSLMNQNNDIQNLKFQVLELDQQLQDLNKLLSDSMTENKNLWQSLYVTQEKNELKIQQFEHIIMSLLNMNNFKKYLSHDSQNDSNPFQNIFESNYKNIISNLIEFVNKGKKPENFDHKKVQKELQFEQKENNDFQIQQSRKSSITDLMLCDQSFSNMHNPYIIEFNKQDDDQQSQNSQSISEKSIFNALQDFN